MTAVLVRPFIFDTLPCIRRVVAALLLTLPACAAEPPERDTLPDVETVLPEARGCLLSIGEPRGVVVDSVVTGTAADGLLSVGDVIVAIDGEATVSAADLMDVMTRRDPGEEIMISLERAGDTDDVALTLGTNPDDASRPQIGILIRTSYESIPIAEATEEVTPSFTSRPLALGDHLVVVDPATGAWGEFEPDTRLGATWVATTEGIYTLIGEEDLVLTDALTEEALDHDGFQDWAPRRLIGSLGARLLIVVTVDIPDQPGFVNVGLALFDPTLGETIWVTPVLNEFGIPVTAFGAPDRSGFVLVGADSETGAVRGVEFYDSLGTLRDVGALSDLGTPVGWFDGTSMAFRPNSEQISIYDFADGSIRNFTVPGGLLDSLIAAVGDGRQIMAIDGRNLLITDLTTGSEVRTLAENCTIARIGEPGWGL
ncbi:MAG: PDZ domain-containing protein [Actinobacteria bacterium]|nr:PDZ domain-containing protein [Actinomycetota bacterium]